MSTLSPGDKVIIVKANRLPELIMRSARILNGPVPLQDPKTNKVYMAYELDIYLHKFRRNAYAERNCLVKIPRRNAIAAWDETIFVPDLEQS